MYPRQARDTLLRLARGFPVLALTGPRQSGKTTLARSTFPQKTYVSLENPDERDLAESDPKRFLARFPEGAILDEVQRCPQLLSWLQGVVDERQVMGQFILTGSVQFDLIAGMSQSLAGRIGRVELLPMSLPEMARGDCLPDSLDDLLLNGGYPAIYQRAGCLGLVSELCCHLPRTGCASDNHRPRPVAVPALRAHVRRSFRAVAQSGGARRGLRYFGSDGSRMVVRPGSQLSGQPATA